MGSPISPRAFLAGIVHSSFRAPSGRHCLLGDGSTSRPQANARARISNQHSRDAAILPALSVVFPLDLTSCRYASLQACAAAHARGSLLVLHESCAARPEDVSHERV